MEKEPKLWTQQGQASATQLYGSLTRELPRLTRPEVDKNEEAAVLIINNLKLDKHNM